MSECEFPLGDKLHEIIRAMICREIDTIFDFCSKVEKFFGKGKSGKHSFCKPEKQENRVLYWA